MTNSEATSPSSVKRQIWNHWNDVWDDVHKKTYVESWSLLYIRVAREIWRTHRRLDRESQDGLMTFTPPRIPKPNPDEYQYATFASHRRQQFKIHRTRAHARSAFTNMVRTNYRDGTVTAYGDVAIYLKQDDEWIPQFELQDGQTIERLPWHQAQ